MNEHDTNGVPPLLCWSCERRVFPDDVYQTWHDGRHICWDCHRAAEELVAREVGERHAAAV